VIRLAVRVARADAELVLAELLVLSPAGLEELEHDDGTVEYAIYGAPGELPALPDLEAAAGEALVHVSTSELPDDWSERWREFHQPVVVGERVRVRPPWSAADGGAGLIDLAIDPGQAFGTGAHATTRLCLELLLGLAPDGALLDVGCGSGVLAIAAAKLGWAPVIGVDHERESVDATRANAAANDVAIDARRLDLRREPLPSAPTVVANLLAPLLFVLAARIETAPRVLIAGGLLVEQADAVAEEFAAKHALVQRERREAGEWAALLLSRRS
jgi:ribosomal protein L11 methyltransferase